MKYIVTLNDKNYEVEVEKGQATILKTTQAAAPVVAQATAAAPTVAAPTVAPTPVANTTAPSSITGEAIKAPMPGTILSVKVSPGTFVKKGDTVVILEAMKMENEIAAAADGTVAKIYTSKSATVSAGDPLLTIV